MSLELAQLGMHEHDGVLIKNLHDGTALQVKIGSDHIDVRFRCVLIADADNTQSNTPEWIDAYELSLGVWRRNDAVVWRWLKKKGIDEIGVYRRLRIRAGSEVGAISATA